MGLPVAKDDQCAQLACSALTVPLFQCNYGWTSNYKWFIRSSASSIIVVSSSNLCLRTIRARMSFEVLEVMEGKVAAAYARPYQDPAALEALSTTLEKLDFQKLLNKEAWSLEHWMKTTVFAYQKVCQLKH
eukprot:500092-Pelagomonas_calceolata.AAC.13